MGCTLAQFVEIVIKPHSVPGAGSTLALPNFFQCKDAVSVLLHPQFL